MRPTRSTKVKIAKATADVEPAETPLEPIFDDKSGKRASPARSSTRSTARTTRPGASTPGPGRRNQPRKAVFVAEKPTRLPDGTMLTF